MPVKHKHPASRVSPPTPTLPHVQLFPISSSSVYRRPRSLTLLPTPVISASAGLRHLGRLRRDRPGRGQPPRRPRRGGRRQEREAPRPKLHGDPERWCQVALQRHLQPDVPPTGRTCLLSQSGAVGLAVLEAAEERGLGIGGFVSVGNSVDVASNDLLTYWGEDPGTDLVLLYLESIPEPLDFVRIARRVSRRMPLVVVKAGRTEAGRRGAASHTAALAAGDLAVDALFHQAGVIRADSIEEMADLATLLSSQQRFSGRRVAIVTNGGGPGVLAADACEANGLVVPELSEPTKAALRRLLAPEASVSNPVDMIAAATARQYGETVRMLGASGEVDALVVMFNTPLITTAEAVADELVVSTP